MSVWLVPVLALVLLYLWLRGWWFAGLLAGFLYHYWNAPDPRSWLWTIAVAAGPWLFWKLATQRGRQFLGGAARAYHEQAEVEEIRKAVARREREERERPQRAWLALPRAERKRRWSEWRAIQAAGQ